MPDINSDVYLEVPVCTVSRVHISDGSPVQYVTLTTPSGGRLDIESADMDFLPLRANGAPRYFHFQFNLQAFVRGSGRDSKQALRVVSAKQQELAVQIQPLKS